MSNLQTTGAWWRWPLMPIASLLAGTLASSLLNVVFFFVVMLFTGEQPKGWGLLYLLPLLSYGMFGYVIALVAYALAPSRKVIAGLVMTVVVFLLMVLVLVSAYVLGTGQPHLLTHLAVGIPAASVFAAVGIVHMHKGLLESPPVAAGP